MLDFKEEHLKAIVTHFSETDNTFDTLLVHGNYWNDWNMKSSMALAILLITESQFGFAETSRILAGMSKVFHP